MPLIKNLFSALGKLIKGKKTRRKKRPPRKTIKKKKGTSFRRATKRKSKKKTVKKKPIKKKPVKKKSVKKKVKSQKTKKAKRTVRTKTRKKVQKKVKKKTPVKKRTKVKKKTVKKKISKRGKNRLKKKALGPPLKGAQKSVHPQGVLVGDITHYFTKIKVCVLKITHHPLKVGDTIEIGGRSSCFSQKVKSLQIESINVSSARKGHLVGLKVEKKAAAGDKVYKL